MGRAFSDVTLDVRPGEVVGLFGKLGSGASEVGETAFGIHRLTSGVLEVQGDATVLKEPTAAISAGIGFLPADRKAGGAFLVRPVAENVAIANWPNLSTMGFISDRIEAKALKRWRDKLSIRSRNDPRQTMGTLSGGNQQKVLLARWLERDSRSLVLIEPTRGVDVGAREDIYRSLRSSRREGVGRARGDLGLRGGGPGGGPCLCDVEGTHRHRATGDQVTTGRLLAAAGG